MKYSVTGKMKLGSEERKFEKKVDAKSENDAREKLYSLLGSVNGLQRSMITIEKIEEVKA